MLSHIGFQKLPKFRVTAVLFDFLDGLDAHFDTGVAFLNNRIVSASMVFPIPLPPLSQIRA